MSTNYVIINNDTSAGILAVEKNVFRDIVKYTIQDSKHLNVPHNLLQNNIAVDYVDEVLVIDVDLTVKFGNRVIGVLENIQQKIHDSITNNSSLKDVIVNINVIGFNF